MLSIQKLLISFLLASSLLSFSQPLVIAREALQVPLSMGAASVAQVGRDFIVKTAQKTQMIKRHNLSAALRGIPVSRLKNVLARGAYLSLSQNNKGDFSLDMRGRLKGGGAWGAVIGCWVGKVGTHALGQVVVHGVTAGTALVCPLAAPVVYSTMQYTFTPLVVEPASTVVALGCGILGGVATGPV